MGAIRIKPPAPCKACKQYPRAEGSSRCEPCSSKHKKMLFNKEQLMQKIKNIKNK